MNNYEKDMFVFLTEEENFDSMLKVMENFNMVRRNLLIDFWNEVAIKLEKLITNPEWCVFNPLDENKNRSDAKLLLYKKQWRFGDNHPFVGLAWEHLTMHPYYGVWCNIDTKNADSQRINNQQLAQDLEDFRKKNQYKTDTNWWPAWKFTGYSFEVVENLKLILPHKREPLANKYADVLHEMTKSVEPIIDSSLITL